MEKELEISSDRKRKSALGGSISKNNWLVWLDADFCWIPRSSRGMTNLILFAKLPTIGTPIPGTTAGWVGNMQRFFKGSADVLALFVMLLLFLTVSYTLLSKFNDWRQGRAELADVTVLAIVAAVVLIIVAILLGVATNVLH